MNVELAGWFSSVWFSSHLSKTISICLYELSEQSHLSNVAAETHTHRSLSHLTQPALVNKVSSSDLWSPWLPPVCSRERAVSHHQNFSYDAICLVSSHAMAHRFLGTTREQTGDNGTSVQTASSHPLPPWLPQTFPLHNCTCPCLCTVRSPQGLEYIYICTHQRSHTWLRPHSWQAPGKLASCPG